MTTQGLIEQWRRQTQLASDWQSGDDPEPVLDALAMSIAIEVTGTMAELPVDERDGLRKLGQRALLHIGGHVNQVGADGKPVLDEDDLEALRMAAALARDGLRALGGRPVDDGAPSDRDLRIVVPPGDLTRLLRGDLDGLAAGSLSQRIRRSEPARAELALLLTIGQESADAERTLALAAASSAAVLDPMDGQTIGSLEALGVEAVFFDGAPRRLAIYAEDPTPLRLLAPELTTLDVREGYWVGKLEDGIKRIEATLQIDDAQIAWTLEFP